MSKAYGKFFWIGSVTVTVSGLGVCLLSLVSSWFLLLFIPIAVGSVFLAKWAAYNDTKDLLESKDD